MKLLSLVAIGLAMAFPVFAQTTTPTEKQEPAQEQTGKVQTKQTAKPDSNRPRDVNQTAQPNEQGRARMRAQENENANPNMREKTRANEQSRFRSEGREGARVQERDDNGSHGVTVFRKGHETTENLNLHRTTREQSDMHFRIGTHDRDWWISSYTIVLMDGCHYYLADNGCWYPAYGFDPSCDYSPGVVYCE